MNTIAYLKEAAARKTGAMPVLSFPAVQKLGITVQDMVSNADSMAKAIRTVADCTPSLAAIAPMDLSVEAEAFGAKVRFSADEIPNVIGKLVEEPEQADTLAVPAVGAGRTQICLDALKAAKQSIVDRPVFGGMIGPFSLAGRLMDVTEIMYLCYDEPEMVHTVLQKATDFLKAYCLAIKQTGADGVFLAEPLAGLLSAEMCGEFSNPYVKQIIDAVQEDSFAVIYHNCGNTVPFMLDALAEMKAAAYHFGNAVNMADILSHAPSDMLCMGNIDPASAFANGTPEGMREKCAELLAACGKYPNFLPSSGCDIPPKASWENIAAFFAAMGAKE